MNRTQASHQNQCGRVNSDEQEKRTEWAKRVPEQPTVFICESVSDPTARPLDVEGSMSTSQMIRLHMQQTGTGYNE